MKVSDWNISYLSLFTVTPSEEDGDCFECLSTRDTFPAEDEVLLSLIDAALVDVFKKKPDINKTSPCKVWRFADTEEGSASKRDLRVLYDSDSLSTWRLHATTFAREYALSSGTKPCFMALLNVSVTPPKGIGGRFFVALTFNHEPLHHYDNHSGLMELIGESSPNIKPSTALIYPFFTGAEYAENSLKIIGKKIEETPGNFLNIVPPMLANEIIMDCLSSSIAERTSVDTYETYINDHQDTRELFNSDSLVSDIDTLEPHLTDNICLNTYVKANDSHGIKPKLSLAIDDDIKVTAPLNLTNQLSFFEHMGEKFLIIKGDSFTTKGPLSGIDLMKPQKDMSLTLEEIIDRLK